MAETIVSFIAACLLLLGCLFCVTGAVGMIRFPNFFARVHATSVTDSLGAGLILIGLALLSDSATPVFKLLFILLFTLITAPTAVHALTKAAMHAGSHTASPIEELPASDEGGPSSKH